MHFGILAARCPLPALQDELVGVGLTPGPPVDPHSPQSDEPIEYVCGEHQGHGYVLDSLFELSSHGDFVVALSQKLQTMVVGCGAETTSGSYWLFAADNGRLLRAYWSCALDLSDPFDEGDWGRDVELEDLDGDGLEELLRHAGLEYGQSTDGRPLYGQPLQQLSSAATLKLPDGSLHERLEQHRALHRIPDGDQPSIGIVLRPAPPSKPTPSSPAGPAPAPSSPAAPTSAPPSPREATAASGAGIVEFALESRRPSPVAALVGAVLVAPYGTVIAGNILLKLLPKPLAYIFAALVGLAIVSFMLRLARRHPAGVLRLEPGGLVHTGAPGGLIAVPTAQLREFVLVDGFLILRRHRGRRIVLDPRRFSVPLTTVAKALADWKGRAGDSAAFASATLAAEQRRQRNQQLLRRAAIVAVALAVIRLLIGHK
jgi:hypothetical protein